MQSMRIGTLLALAAMSGFLTWAFGGFTARFLFGVWGGTAAYAVLVWLLPTGPASVSRRMPQRMLHPGEILQVEVAVKGRSWLPVAWMAVTDRWVREQDGMSYSFRQLIGASRWGKRSTVSYSVSGLPRGTYRLAGTELVSGDLLGFVTKRRVMEAESDSRTEGRDRAPHMREIGSVKDRFVVLPQAKLLTSIRLPVSAGPEERDSSRSKERFPRQQTTNGSVREYVTGDPLSRIHWKSTARMGQWMTRAEEPTEDLELWIALDAHESLLEGGPAMARRWEAAIAWTAGMLREAAETQAKLGLLANDRMRQQDDPAAPYGDSGDHRPVHSGPAGGLADWMQRLSGLKMDGSIRLGEMLLAEDGRLIRPGQALLCVTTVISEELTEALLTLRLRGRHIGLIHVHECPAYPERERCRRLAAMGCEVQIVTELGLDREVLPHVQYEGA